MAPDSGPLPPLPREVVVRILERLPIVAFLRGAAATCRQFSLKWYLGQSFRQVVFVPDDEQGINAAMNRLALEGDGRGLVLVRPGVYSEAVRVTQNCYVLGFGPRKDVVVEAPGWESALVSAGLGGSHMPKALTNLGWCGFTSGEAACVENMTFRCRNEQMRGRCVYIVMGQLQLVRCVVDGGVLVSGTRTAPRFSECLIRKSRGTGLRFTDHSRASVNRSYVGHHGGHGVLIERNSQPQIDETSICDNGGYGIRVYCGVNAASNLSNLSNLSASASPASSSWDRINNNYFEGNETGELSLTPRFADCDLEDVGVCETELEL